MSDLASLGVSRITYYVSRRPLRLRSQSRPVPPPPPGEETGRALFVSPPSERSERWGESGVGREGGLGVVVP